MKKGQEAEWGPWRQQQSAPQPEKDPEYPKLGPHPPYPSIGNINTITLQVTPFPTTHALLFKGAILGFMRSFENIKRYGHPTIPSLTKIINMQRTRDETRAGHTADPGTSHNIVKMSPHPKADVMHLPMFRKVFLK